MYRYQKRAIKERDNYRQALFGKGVVKGIESKRNFESDSIIKIQIQSDNKLNQIGKSNSNCKLESEITKKIKLGNKYKLRIYILTENSQNNKILIFLPSFSPWHGG